MLERLIRIARRRDEAGASAVEYGLLVAAIAAIIVLIVFALGRIVNESFTDTCSNIAAQGSGTISSTCS